MSAWLACMLVAHGIGAPSPEPCEAPGQIFYRNEFEFETGQGSYGASAFFSRIDGQLVLITARHLLGPAMGITPAIRARDFDRLIEEWRVLSPRDRPVATVERAFAWHDPSDGDRIAFSVRLLPAAPAPQILPIATDPPIPGEIMYLIGCPYSKSDCMQDVYPLRYHQSHRNELIFLGAPEDVDFSGFSGAPIINRDGAVVGVMTAAGTRSSVWATDLTDVHSRE